MKTFAKDGVNQKRYLKELSYKLSQRIAEDGRELVLTNWTTHNCIKAHGQILLYITGLLKPSFMYKIYLH